MTPLARVHRGDSALVVDVPHAGTHVPDAIASRLTAAARALLACGHQQGAETTETVGRDEAERDQLGQRLLEL